MKLSKPIIKCNVIHSPVIASLQTSRSFTILRPNTKGKLFTLYSVVGPTF